MFIAPIPSNENTPVGTSDIATPAAPERRHLRVATSNDTLEVANHARPACDRFPAVDDILDRLTSYTDLAKQAAGHRG